MEGKNASSSGREMTLDERKNVYIRNMSTRRNGRGEGKKSIEKEPLTDPGEHMHENSLLSCSLHCGMCSEGLSCCVVLFFFHITHCTFSFFLFLHSFLSFSSMFPSSCILTTLCGMWVMCKVLSHRDNKVEDNGRHYKQLIYLLSKTHIDIEKCWMPLQKTLVARELDY